MALNQKYRTGIWLAMVLSIAGLYLVFKTIPRISFQSGAPRVNWVYLGIGFLVLVAVWMAKSMRMYLIGNGMGAKINLWRYFQIYMATCFISHVTPFNSGGTPLQIYLLHGQDITVGKASAITVVDLGLNTILFFLLSLVTFISQGAGALTKGARAEILQTGWISGPGVWIFPILLIIVIVVVFVLIQSLKVGARDSRNETEAKPFTKPPVKVTAWLARIPPMVYSFLERKGWPQNFRREYALFKEGWQTLAKQKPAQIYGGILATAIYWLGYLSLAPLILGALGKPVSFTGPLSFVSLIGEQLLFNLAQIFIPTPGGSGGAELIMSYLFRNITGPGDIGWFVLLWRIYTFFSTLIIGGYFFIHLTLKQRKKD